MSDTTDMNLNHRPIEERARRYQRVSDALSVGRGVLGIALGVEIATNKQARTPLAIAGVLILSATDYIDGRLARKARHHDRSIDEKIGARVDQLSDKAMTHAILTGLTINALRNRKYGHAATLAINQITQGVRDIKVTPVRALAEKYNVNAGARSDGKNKTVVNTFALAAATLPLAENYHNTANVASDVVLTAGSYLSVASGISLVDELRAGIAEKQAATFAPGDTTQVLELDILPSELQ